MWELITLSLDPQPGFFTKRTKEKFAYMDPRQNNNYQLKLINGLLLEMMQGCLHLISQV